MRVNIVTSIFMPLFAALIIVAMLILAWNMVVAKIPPENRELSSMLLGGLLSLSNLVVGFYFGNSHRSEQRASDGDNIQLRKEKNNVQEDRSVRETGYRSHVQRGGKRGNFRNKG